MERTLALSDYQALAELRYQVRLFLHFSEKAARRLGFGTAATPIDACDAFEITRDYNSVLPLMLVTVIADGVAILLMPKAPIMTEKLIRRGLRIHQDYEADVLQQMVVSETMDHDAPSISAGMPVREGRAHYPSRAESQSS
jgi:hypothetical protein